MTLLAGVYASMIGLSVRAVNPSFSADESELAAGWFLAQLPMWMLAIFSAFLMATIVSTTGSALQSVVTNLVRDVYVEVRGERSDKHLIKVAKSLTVVVTAVAALLAISSPTALDWLVATYAYSASTLAAPIFVGYLLHRRGTLSAASAIAGMVGGLIGCATAHIAATTIPYAVYGIVVSTICVVSVQVLLKPRTPAQPTPAMHD